MDMAHAPGAGLDLQRCAEAGRRPEDLVSAGVGLPVRPTDVPGVEWDVDELILSMAKDKKVQDGRITFVLVRGLGDAFTLRDVEPAQVRALLEEAVSR